MNTLGKVFAFLVVIAAIAASILTAKLVEVRNSWTAKTLAAKNKFNETQPKIETLEAQIDSLQKDIFRSRDLWGNFWPIVQTNVVSPDGAVQVNVGSAAGVREGLQLHGFELLPDGTSVYRGSFVPAEIQQNGSVLKPNWRATPAEVATWGKAGNWRWRNLVPPGYTENFDKQLTTILKLEETLGDRMLTLKGQEQLLVEANNKLKLREAELLGGEELAGGDQLEPEYREGLVAAMERTEEERNELLLKIDDLRRKVRSVKDDIDRILVENTELTNRLPQPGTKSELSQAK
ncbi:hypothetical protein [Schlesneria sp. DSM 10557]|uniref:hypothetical protein n=1 Tax=Schlesneria sp. DSM 10557 TaxID=3044399 RepID=UPI0035A1A77C